MDNMEVIWNIFERIFNQFIAFKKPFDLKNDLSGGHEEKNTPTFSSLMLAPCSPCGSIHSSLMGLQGSHMEPSPAAVTTTNLLEDWFMAHLKRTMWKFPHGQHGGEMIHTSLSESSVNS